MNLTYERYGLEVPLVESEQEVSSSSGEEVELCPGGEGKPVVKQNYQEYIDLVLQARSYEASEQMKSV